MAKLPTTQLSPTKSDNTNMPHHTYILLCSNNSYYVGSTSNLKTRLTQHNQGHGSLHTRKHRPVKLIYQEKHSTRSAAMQREKQIKGWTRVKKKALVDGTLYKLKVT
jgi:putative endonuclease